MRRKQKLAILASCIVMCSAGFAAVAGAEEADKNSEDTILDEVVVTAAAFKQLNPVNSRRSLKRRSRPKERKTRPRH